MSCDHSPTENREHANVILIKIFILKSQGTSSKYESYSDDKKVWEYLHYK